MSGRILIGALLVLSGMSMAASMGVAQTAAGDSNLRVYVDPATGRFLSQPPAEIAAPQAQKPAQRAAAAMPTVEAGTSPAGGVLIHLGDRFVSDGTVNVAPDGSLSGHCDLPHDKQVSP